MSSATTIHDGCGSLVHLLLLCILLILSMSISYTASTYAALSYIGCTLLWKEIQKLPNRQQISHFESSFEADLLNI